jgi:Bifunctional DNA primase/polymerase, N-terminal
VRSPAWLHPPERPQITLACKGDFPGKVGTILDVISTAVRTEGQTPEQAAVFHAALDLYAKGYRLLPIGPEKLPYFSLLPHTNGKAEWTSLRTNRADANTICQWFQESPDCNIGVICGNGLLVADVDGPIGREKIASLGEIPPTVTALTGRENGGHHYYLRLRPGVWKRNAKGEDLHQHHHIDLQVDGYYVIAPPSLHHSGRRYKWADDFGPDDVVVADAPEWLYDFLEEVQTSTALEPSGTDEGGVPREAVNTEGLRTPIGLYKSIGVTDTPVLPALDTDPWSLARDYQVMQKMARVCDGLEKEIWAQPGPPNDKGLRPCSAAFFCVLPGRGHQDLKSKSASLFIDAKTGCLKYRCWHGGLDEDESQTRFIWEAFYTLRTKDQKTLKGATLNFWLKMHLTVAGAWTLPDVPCKGPCQMDTFFRLGWG